MSFTVSKRTKDDALPYGRTQENKGTARLRLSCAAKERNNKMEQNKDYTNYYKKCTARLGMTDYLEKRGIPGDVAKKMYVGYDPEYRFPWNDENGSQMVGGAIIIPTSKTSYVVRSADENSPHDKRYCKRGSAEFFNFKALAKADQPVFVTEGEIDALSVMTCGYQAVALGSVNNVEKFVECLLDRGLKPELILALDNDRQGRHFTDELSVRLKKNGIPFEISPFCMPENGYKDINEMLVKAPRELEKALSDLAGCSKEMQEKAGFVDKISASKFIPQFLDEIQNVRYTTIPTGFARLDKAFDGGLRFGTYTIGALPSLGKSSFVLQIADQIAKSGTDVLIFSLEMNRQALVAKSVSRLILQERLKAGTATRKIITANDVLSGERYQSYSQEVRDEIFAGIDEYRQSIAPHIMLRTVMPGIKGRIGADQIHNEISDVLDVMEMQGKGRRLVVVIDYLQLIAAHSDRATDKAIIDYNTAVIEGTAHEFGIPIIVISSLNREGYSREVSMSSFKESGGIEYNTDQLLGMQYQGVAGNSFDIREAMAENPRKIELVILKQRLGEISGKIGFDFYPAGNLFIEN